MPTQSTTYNTRLTDEALEKRFRDTFRSQGGAELVDDLYASGVIVPVVDFTAAAEGSALRQDLQTAWDISTGSIQITSSSPTTIISNAGFWQVDLIYAGFASDSGSSRFDATVDIYDGVTYNAVWAYTNQTGSSNVYETAMESSFVVFLRANDTLTGQCQSSARTMNVWYRQIATVNGDLVQPFGYFPS